jgi:hypothetical protein
MMHVLFRAQVYLLVGCVAAFAACSKPSQSSGQSAASPQAIASATETPSATASTAAATPSPTPSGTPALPTVAYTDINGIFAQQAITNEAELGAFGTPAGQFNPNGRISRGQYVEWLVTLNNIYFSEDASKQFRYPETAEQTFVDVPQSNPYWKYVQALVDAGFIVGVDATHFAPERPITRQEMVAIKFQVDIGQKATPDPSIHYTNLSAYVDAKQVNKLYLTAVDDDIYDGGSHNIQRIWGKTVYLHPRKDLTRAEAALSLDSIAGAWSKNAVASLQGH